MGLTPFEDKFNPFQNRKHHRLFNGTWTYSDKPLSQTPGAIRKRRWEARVKTLIDARICQICSYAFISRGGKNVCSECWRELCRLYRRSRKRFIGKCHLMLVRQWAGKEFGYGHFHKPSTNPRIPIPDLDSPRVQTAIRQTLELMKKSSEDGVWYVHQMPRLPLPPYRVEN